MPANRPIAQPNIRLRAENAQLQRDLRTANRRLERSLRRGARRAGRTFDRTLAQTIRAPILRLGSQITSVFTGQALLLGIRRFGQFVSQATTRVDDLTKAAERLEVSADALQTLQLAADEAGVSFETLERVIGRFNINLGDAIDGTGAATDAFEDLGLDAQALSAQGLVEQLSAVDEALANIADPARRAAIRSDIFGVGGRRAGNLLGTGTLGARASEAGSFLDRIGARVTSIDREGTARLRDVTNRLSRAFEELIAQLTVKLAPGLASVGERILDDFPPLMDVMKDAFEDAATGLDEFARRARISGNIFQQVAEKVEDAFGFLIPILNTASFVFGAKAVNTGFKALTQHSVRGQIKRDIADIDVRSKISADEIAKANARRQRRFKQDEKTRLSREEIEADETLLKFLERQRGATPKPPALLTDKPFQDELKKQRDALQKKLELEPRPGSNLGDALKNITGFVGITYTAEQVKDIKDIVGGVGESIMRQAEKRAQELADVQAQEYLESVFPDQESQIKALQEFILPHGDLSEADERAQQYIDRLKHVGPDEQRKRDREQRIRDRANERLRLQAETANTELLQRQNALAENFERSLQRIDQSFEDSRRWTEPFANARMELEALREATLDFEDFNPERGEQLATIETRLDRLNTASVRELRYELEGISQSLIPTNGQFKELAEQLQQIQDSEFGPHLQDELKGIHDRMVVISSGVADIWQATTNRMGSAIDQMIDGASLSFRDFAASMLRDWAKVIARITLFGQDGTSGIFGSIFGSLIGGLGGLFKAAPVAEVGPGFDFASFAEGGRFKANKPMLIGEEGPEFLIPDKPGYIIPNDILKDLKGRQIDDVDNFQGAFATGGRILPNRPALVGEMGVEAFIPQSYSVSNQTLTEIASANMQNETKGQSFNVTQNISSGVSQQDLAFGLAQAKTDMLNTLIDMAGGRAELARALTSSYS